MPEVPIEESRRFMVQSLVAAGAPESEARAQAELLLHADLTGHFSHGLNRLELYLHDIKVGATLPSAKPVILKESPATAWVDGNEALGATIGNFCMDVAIRKAKESGVGWVSAKRCNHFGMAGWWAQKAEKEGLIGMAFTNSSPVMVPTRAKHSATGTNPISMCAPAADGDSACGSGYYSCRYGQEVQIHKDQSIPEGWALGPDGQPTTDSKAAFNTGRLLPLGGFENTSGYKGYCLSAMVEAFCSGLSGSKSSHQVRSWALDSPDTEVNLGQCFVAIDPNCFAPGFGDRIKGCLDHWRSLEPVDPSLPVLAPGDKEKTSLAKTEEKGVITYPQKLLYLCNHIARTHRIEPMKTL